jgi:hypothetical protein
MFAPHEENQQACSFVEFNIKCAAAISKKGDGFFGANHDVIHRQVLRVSAAIVYKAIVLGAMQRTSILSNVSFAVRLINPVVGE